MTLLDDAEVEARVREALHAVAERTRTDGLPYADDRSGRRGLPIVAAAAAVLAVVAGVLVAGRGEPDRAVTEAPPSSSSTTAPAPVAGAEPSGTGGAVFRADGSPAEVAEAYLRSRFPDFPQPGVALGDVVAGDVGATARWSTDVATGTIRLVDLDGTWAVVEAATDGVEVRDLRIEGGRLRARVVTTMIDSLFADVLDLDGEPVPGAPRPGGQPGAAYRFGTAGGPADGILDVDVPVGDEPVVLRVHLVGGTLLSVSETSIQRLPAARLVVRDEWAGGPWLLRAADSFPGHGAESPCVWLELVDRPAQALCGVGPEVGAMGSLGPVAQVDGERIHLGAFGQGVIGVRVRGEEHTTFVDPAHPDGATYVVFTAPAGGPVDVEVLADGGVVLTTVTLQDGPVGG